MIVGQFLAVFLLANNFLINYSYSDFIEKERDFFIVVWYFYYCYYYLDFCFII